MVSLPPPVNPNSASHVEPSAVGKRPESVRFMLGCWAAMILGELTHQILTVGALVLDPSELQAAAKEAAKAQGGDVPEAVMNASMWGSVAVMTLIQLSIIALFAIALRALSAQKSWAERARRLLQVFSVFFALRALVVFAARPASTTIPLAYFAADGVVQIIVGVAGVLGLIYASQKESIHWAEAGNPQAGKGA